MTLQSQGLIFEFTKIETLRRTAAVNEHWNTCSDSHETSVQQYLNPASSHKYFVAINAYLIPI